MARSDGSKAIKPTCDECGGMAPKRRQVRLSGVTFCQSCHDKVWRNVAMRLRYPQIFGPGG